MDAMNVPSSCRDVSFVDVQISVHRLNSFFGGGEVRWFPAI